MLDFNDFRLKSENSLLKSENVLGNFRLFNAVLENAFLRYFLEWMIDLYSNWK